MHVPAGGCSHGMCPSGGAVGRQFCILGLVHLHPALLAAGGGAGGCGRTVPRGGEKQGKQLRWKGLSSTSATHPFHRGVHTGCAGPTAAAEGPINRRRPETAVGGCASSQGANGAAGGAPKRPMGTARGARRGRRPMSVGGEIISCRRLPEGPTGRCFAGPVAPRCE